MHAPCTDATDSTISMIALTRELQGDLTATPPFAATAEFVTFKRPGKQIHAPPDLANGNVGVVTSQRCSVPCIARIMSPADASLGDVLAWPCCWVTRVKSCEVVFDLHLHSTNSRCGAHTVLQRLLRIVRKAGTNRART